MLFQMSLGITAYADEFDTSPAVSGGTDYTLALKSNGTVWSWGENRSGQLGDGSTMNRLRPVPVSGLSDITAVSAGESHSLAIGSNGIVWAWGSNTYGQLGNGTTSQSFIPVQVSELSGVTAVAALDTASLALKSDGTVWAFGENFQGQLGNGTNTDSMLPIQVMNLTNVKAIAAAGDHCLALKTDGTVWYWGDTLNGSVSKYSTPVRMNELSDVAAVSLGAHSAAVLKNDGTVWTWGTNWQGQLGTGDLPEKRTGVPVQVEGVSDVKTISTKGWHTVVQKNDGSVWGWGYNEYGQLGNSDNADSTIPVKMNNILSPALSVAGVYHSVILKNDGNVWTCGRNEAFGRGIGALGDGSTVNRNELVQVIGENSEKMLNLFSDGWFRDVPRTEWYYDAVKYMVTNDIMVGTSDMTFKPEETLDRSMVAMVLYKLENCPTVGITSNFTDTVPGAWYEDAVNWAFGTEVIVGYGGSRFGPEDKITREQFATMVYNYAKMKGIDVSPAADLSDFADSGRISEWAVVPMSWAVATGLIAGTSETELSPLGSTTRGQCAMITMKWMTRISAEAPSRSTPTADDGSAITPPDGDGSGSNAPMAYYPVR